MHRDGQRCQGGVESPGCFAYLTAAYNIVDHFAMVFATSMSAILSGNCQWIQAIGSLENCRTAVSALWALKLWLPPPRSKPWRFPAEAEWAWNYITPVHARQSQRPGAFRPIICCAWASSFTAVPAVPTWGRRAPAPCACTAAVPAVPTWGRRAPAPCARGLPRGYGGPPQTRPWPTPAGETPADDGGGVEETASPFLTHHWPAV